jgi:uncharacterized membrane protein YgdD (TMEM256/DUF423 family)
MINNRNIWIIIAGAAGFSGVAFGAFGAHILEAQMTPAMIKTYQTGVLYHLIHAAVITVIAVAADKRFFKAALFFSIGIMLFSFSLYLLSVTGVKFLAYFTPLGGLSFLTGWILIFIEGMKNNSGHR